MSVLVIVACVSFGLVNFEVSMMAVSSLFGMISVSEIQEKINAGTDRIDAILQLAEEEERELTEDEQKEVNAFHGEGEEPGEFGKLNDQLAQAKKIEARRKKIAADRLGGRATEHQQQHAGGNGGTGDPYSGIVVPAVARRHGAIAAFGTGPQAQRDAYVSGRWILAKLHGHQESQDWLDENGVSANIKQSAVQAAMSGGAASLGNELIPDPLEAAIIRIIEQWGILRQHARPVTMVAPTQKIPNRVGGLTVYYPDENETITPSDMTIDQIAVTAKKYATLTKISSELTEDSVISVANELATEIGIAFALAEDTNGFLGDGTAAFASTTGLESKLGANSKLVAAGNNVGAITLDNYEQLVAKLPMYMGSMPCWFCNSAVHRGSMIPLMNASGGTTGHEISEGYDAMFLGYPVKYVQAMPAAPASGKAAAFFGTLAQAVYMGHRRGITIATSSEFYFGDDAIAIRGTERVGIEVENQDTNQAGPVVELVLA